jgi:hypothetical protein
MVGSQSRFWATEEKGRPGADSCNLTREARSLEKGVAIFFI